MTVTQRLADDHLGQLIDEAVVLRQGNEAHRRDEAVVRVLPTGKRLHADPVPRAKTHLGLIPGQQLILLQRPAQLIQRQAVAIFLLGPLLLWAPGADQLADLLLAGGLFDAPKHLQAIGGAHPQHGLDHVIFQCTGEDDTSTKAPEGQTAQQRHAIHAGHAQIAKQNVDLMALTHCQCLHAILSLQQ